MHSNFWSPDLNGMRQLRQFMSDENELTFVKFAVYKVIYILENSIKGVACYRPMGRQI